MLPEAFFGRGILKVRRGNYQTVVLVFEYYGDARDFCDKNLSCEYYPYLMIRINPMVIHFERETLSVPLQVVGLLSRSLKGVSLQMCNHQLTTKV